MVPECDSHWVTPPAMSQSTHGSHPEASHSGSTYSSKKRQTNEAQQQQQQLDEAQLVQIATDAFVRELGIEDETVLKDKVQIREVPAGTYLMKEESHKVCYFIFVKCKFIYVQSFGHNYKVPIPFSFI
jgi:lysophospholipid hydrolase